MRFRDLNNGEYFDFANSPKGADPGPWMKISSRKYMAISMDHRLYGIEIRVGSWNAEVYRNPVISAE